MKFGFAAEMARNSARVGRKFLNWSAHPAQEPTAGVPGLSSKAVNLMLDYSPR
jgi:hypothetical protein